MCFERPVFQRENASQFRPLAPNRVSSSAGSAQSAPRALRAAADPSDMSMKKQQDLFEHRVLQAASPQKILPGKQNCISNPKWLGGPSVTDARGRTAFSPSPNLEEPGSLQRESAGLQKPLGEPLESNTSFMTPSRQARSAFGPRWGPHPKVEEPCALKMASLGLVDSPSTLSSSTSSDRSASAASTQPMSRRRSVAKQPPTQSVHRRSRSEALSVRLDQETFKNFWPLLDDSRDYARLSGCRFRSRSFDGIAGEELQQDVPNLWPKASTTRAHSDDTNLTEARARAAPAVYSFAERLRAGESALLEELDKAFRIVMAESVRSAMIATCQLLELWPPGVTQMLTAGVDPDDCAFEDVSAPLPAIAMRLYNDELRRRGLTSQQGDTDPMRRRAMMASFIVEFATAAGTPLPELPETYDMMLKEFKVQASQWEFDQENQPRPSSPPAELMLDAKTANQGVHCDSSRKENEVPKPSCAAGVSMWQAMPSYAPEVSMWPAVALAALLGKATAGCGSSADRWQKKMEF